MLVRSRRKNLRYIIVEFGIYGSFNNLWFSGIIGVIIC